MGNSSSSGRAHHDESVDLGYLTPQGIYTGPRDWNQAIVTQLIIDRKLAPFYRPLEDYEDTWDDEQIIAAMKEPQQPDGTDGEGSITRAESLHSASSRTHHKRPSAATKEPVRHPEAAVYRGAIECPICFLYYPPNINRSRCCDQAICTECFVQIKRADPTTTHLVSEPASCPYCVQENFGIVYTPPSWRAGIGSEGSTPPSWSDVRGASSSEAAAKRRRKSFGADSPDVVTIDQIRPDWEAKLAAVRAAVARRANRRIIMRQVGDRLIPVGITSGRVHALPTEDTPDGAEAGGERGSRRRRRNQNTELNQYLGTMGLGGQDLEELMVMEAMRLSLIEHEEQQRRQRDEEEKKKKGAEGGATIAAAGGEDAGSSAVAGGDAGPTPHPLSVSSPTDSSPALLTPDGPASPTSANFGHRSSSSISRLSGQLSPDSSDGSGAQRSPSPLGALGTAIRSATTTASAVGSPPPEAGSNSNEAAAAQATRNVLGSDVPSLASVIRTDAVTTTTTSRTSLPAGDAQIEATPTAAALAAGVRGSSSSSPAASEVARTEVSSPSINDHTAVPSPVITTRSLPPADVDEASPRPISARTASFASSMVSEDTTTTEAYDYLPSSPASSASSLAHKPLLDQSPSIPPQGYNAAGDANNVGA